MSNDGAVDQDGTDENGNKLSKSGYVWMVAPTTFPFMLDVKCERKEESWSQGNINLHSGSSNFFN